MIVLLPPEVDPQACPAFGAVVHHLHGPTMGTVWQLRLAGPARADLDAVRALVEAELAVVIAQMSHWAEDSELARFNRAPAGHAMTVSPGFAEVLTAALEVARASGGAFDPGMGAWVQAWGFGAWPRREEPGFAAGFVPPGAAGVPAVPPWQRLRLDRPARLLWQPGGLRLDLSAIAKGYAVDRIGEQLQARGWVHGLFEIGGELRGWGLRPDGQPWWVDLAMPEGLPPQVRVALHGVAVATSGDEVQRWRDAQGRWRSHTLDPRHGRPVEHDLASVSVLHAQCMLADAWATALLVLGAEAGLALADRLGLAAVMVRRDPQGRCTTVFSAAMQPWRE